MMNDFMRSRGNDMSTLKYIALSIALAVTVPVHALGVGENPDASHWSDAAVEEYNQFVAEEKEAWELLKAQVLVSHTRGTSREWDLITKAAEAYARAVAERYGLSSYMDGSRVAVEMLEAHYTCTLKEK